MVVSSLSSPCPAFVISLPRSVERRKVIDSYMKLANIDFEWIEGVDGRTLDPNNVPFGISPPWYLKNSSLPGDMKIPTVLACFLSHIKAWQTIKERKLDKALILEDDALIGSDFPKIIEDLCAFPVAWDIVRLGVYLQCTGMPLPYRTIRKGYFTPLIMRSLLLHRKFDSTGAGYLLSYSGANKLLNRLEKRKSLYLPLDFELDLGWQFSENLLQLYFGGKCILHNGRYDAIAHPLPSKTKRKKAKLFSRERWEQTKQRIKREKFRLLTPNFSISFVVWFFLCSVRLFVNAWLWRVRIVWLKQYRRDKMGW